MPQRSHCAVPAGLRHPGVAECAIPRSTGVGLVLHHIWCRVSLTLLSATTYGGYLVNMHELQIRWVHVVGRDVERAKKLVAEIRRNRRSQSPEDLARAANALGFMIDRSRSKGFVHMGHSLHWAQVLNPDYQKPCQGRHDHVDLADSRRGVS